MPQSLPVVQAIGTGASGAAALGAGQQRPTPNMAPPSFNPQQISLPQFSPSGVSNYGIPASPSMFVPQSGVDFDKSLLSILSQMGGGR